MTSPGKVECLQPKYKESEKELQVGGLMNALCQGEELCINSSTDGSCSRHPFSLVPCHGVGKGKVKKPNCSGLFDLPV